MEIAVGIMGVAVTILAGVITYLAWRNGKITRENTEKILKAMEQSSERILKAIEYSVKVSSENSERILRAQKESMNLLALLILAETPEEKKELAKKILA